MAQIGFTPKQERVYTRFQDMRRAYEAAHGRTYAPGFLTVLMDAYEQQNIRGGVSLKALLEATKEVYELTPDEIASIDAAIVDCAEPVSLRAYIANAEVNALQLKTGWAGTDPDEFFREHGYRTDLEPENETE